jgi:hypothetical protein
MSSAGERALQKLLPKLKSFGGKGISTDAPDARLNQFMAAGSLPAVLQPVSSKVDGAI